MTATTLTCGWCRQRGPIEWHHITGSGPNRRHVDPDLVVPLCPSCHELAGADARAERLERLSGSPWTLVGSVETWLRRAAVFVSRTCEFLDFPWLVALAEALRRNAEALASHVSALDAILPGWEHLCDSLSVNGAAYG